jgi:hypothetical protein
MSFAAAHSMVSRGAPRATPAISRPFERQSSMASSSARRSGSWIGSRFAYTRILSLRVILAMAAAIRLGELPSPKGVP